MPGPPLRDRPDRFAGRRGALDGIGGVSDPPVYPLEVAFALTELGSRMQAQRYRREHPEADEAEADTAVRSWLHDCPGAPDGVGRSIGWPRVQ